MPINRTQVSRFCEACKYEPIGTRFSLLSLAKGQVLMETHASHHFIFFFLSGSCQARIYEHPEIEVQAQEMLFSAQGFSYHIEAIEDTEVLIHSYDVPEMICNIGSAYNLQGMVTQIDYQSSALQIRPVLLDYLQTIRRYLSDGIGCEQLQLLKQKELSVIFLYYYSGEEQARFFYYILQCLNSFKSKVFKYYLSAKSVEDLANKCGYSRSTFQREFKKYFQANPHQWMEIHAARFVKNKIVETNLPLKHIVDEFGFSSISHLASYCRRYFGMTANDLRKSLGNQPERDVF